MAKAKFDRTPHGPESYGNAHSYSPRYFPEYTSSGWLPDQLPRNSRITLTSSYYLDFKVGGFGVGGVKVK